MYASSAWTPISRFRSATPASESIGDSCRTCSAGSGRRIPHRRASRGGLGSGSRSRATSSRCTAARYMAPAAAPGEGSTFRVRLPVVAAPSPTAEIVGLHALRIREARDTLVASAAGTQPSSTLMGCPIRGAHLTRLLGTLPTQQTRLFRGPISRYARGCCASPHQLPGVPLREHRDDEQDRDRCVWYWRCVRCGEVWNAVRQERNRRSYRRPFLSGR